MAKRRRRNTGGMEKDYWSKRGATRTLHGRVPHVLKYAPHTASGHWAKLKESQGLVEELRLGDLVSFRISRSNEPIGSYTRTKDGRYVVVAAKTEPNIHRLVRGKPVTFSSEAEARKALIGVLGRPKRTNPSGRPVRSSWKPLLGYAGIEIKVVGAPSDAYSRRFEAAGQPTLLGTENFFRRKVGKDYVQFGSISKFWDATNEPAGEWVYAIFSKHGDKYAPMGVAYTPDSAIRRLVYGVASGSNPPKSRLGSGKRFKALVKKLGARGVRDPKALAAWIGRKRYGAAKMAKMASAGRKRKGTKVVRGTRFGARKVAANVGRRKAKARIGSGKRFVSRMASNPRRRRRN